MGNEKDVAILLLGGPKVQSRIDMADTVKKGLSARALERVKQELELTDGEVAATLGVSAKTLSRARRRKHAALDPVMSDRLYRLARIYTLARDVLESDTGAHEWLRSPQVGLGGRVPLELVATEAGAREVEDLLGRIEYSVLS